MKQQCGGLSFNFFVRPVSGWIYPFFILGAVVLFAGCRDKQKSDKEEVPAPVVAPAVSSPEDHPDVAEQVSSTEVEPVRDSESQPADPAQYPAGRDEILQLEEDAKFVEALQLCRDLSVNFSALPEIRRELDVIRNRLIQSRRHAPKVQVALDALVSSDRPTVAYARNQIEEAGDVGLIYLRKAVRDSDEKLAIMAADMLIRKRDPGMASSFIVRLKDLPEGNLRSTLIKGLKDLNPPGTVSGILKMIQEKSSPSATDLLFAVLPADSGDQAELISALREDPDPALAPVLAEAINRRQAGNITAALMRAVLDGLDHPSTPMLVEILTRVDRLDHGLAAKFHQVVKDDTEFKHRMLVPCLFAFYAGECGKSAGRYALRVNDTEGMQVLSRYVGNALRSKDRTIEDWGFEQIHQFDAKANGLKGSYFIGRNFEKPVHVRLDTVMDFKEDNLPYPGAPPAELSARWTGSLLINRDGDYKFMILSGGDWRMAIGKTVLQGKASDAPVEQMLSLTNGIHSLEVEFQRDRAGAGFRISWSGRFIDEQPLSGDSLITTPWKGMWSK